MFSVPVTDEQYRQVAELAGIPDWQLSPVDDPEFEAMRAKVDFTLERALAAGLKAMREATLLGPGDGIEHYTQTVLDVLSGVEQVPCDTCEKLIARGQSCLRLAGDVLEVACLECNAARRV